MSKLFDQPNTKTKVSSSPSYTFVLRGHELGSVGTAEPGNKPWFAFFAMHSLPMIVQFKLDLYTNSSHHLRLDVLPQKSSLTGCSRGRSSGATWIPQLKVRRNTLLSDLQPSLSSSCRSLLFNALFTSSSATLPLSVAFSSSALSIHRPPFCILSFLSAG